MKGKKAVVQAALAAVSMTDEEWAAHIKAKAKKQMDDLLEARKLVAEADEPEAAEAEEESEEETEEETEEEEESNED